MKINFKKFKSLSFLAIGKTQESKEAGEGSFKRYVGIGSSYVLDVNPNKEKLDALLGYTTQNEPEYIKDGDKGKEAYITFIVKTDPAVNNGIEIVNKLTFTLRMVPACNKDETKVQVIDGFGNHTWMNYDDAKAGKPVLTANGNPAKIDTKYRIACSGECDLIDFLKKYLCVPDAFSYVNGTWVKGDNAAECAFALEHINDYFKGDFQEIREAIALQPNNKVKLLYGVRTNDEGKQYQTVCTRGDLILSNAANVNALTRLEKNLVNAKQNGAYQNTDYRVCELQEWTVEPTNLENPVTTSEDLPFSATATAENSMPWDD